MNIEDVEKSATGLLKNLVNVPLSADKVVVKTGKNVVGFFSPALADRMVSIDHSFKEGYGELVKRTANIGLKVVGRSWK